MAKKEIVNQVVITGEVIDFIDVKKGVAKNGNAYFGYTLRLETDKDTNEIHDVEFFEFETTFSGESNNKYKGMCTAYETYKSRVSDEVGEIVRVTGKLTINSYVSKNDLKIVNKVVVKGQYMHSKAEGTEKEIEEGAFEPCAIFKGIIFVDKMNKISEEQLEISALINEYKSEKKIIGHSINIMANGKDIVGGVESLFSEDTIAKVGLNLVDLVETIYLDEDKTVELEKRELIGFGTGLDEIKQYNEWVEKENERRKILREEGIKVHKQILEITGCSRIFTEEDIEKESLPFEKIDVDDMFDNIYRDQDELENELSMLKVDSQEVPF